MTHPIHPPEMIEALGNIDSPTVSNAIEHFQVRDRVKGYTTADLVCQFPEYKPMVGYAVTCMADTTTPGDDRPPRMDELWDLVNMAPKPVVVVIQHVGLDRKRSCFVGDMSATALQKLGAVGVVTDGANRDRSGMAARAPGFQVFSTGWVASHGKGAYLEFNVNVSLCGMNVRPGDLLHGDENGVLLVPHEIAADVVTRSQVVRDQETDYFQFLESDDFEYEEWKRRLAAH